MANELPHMVREAGLKFLLELSPEALAGANTGRLKFQVLYYTQKSRI